LLQAKCKVASFNLSHSISRDLFVSYQDIGLYSDQQDISRVRSGSRYRHAPESPPVSP